MTAQSPVYLFNSFIVTQTFNYDWSETQESVMHATTYLGIPQHLQFLSSDENGYLSIDDLSQIWLFNRGAQLGNEHPAEILRVTPPGGAPIDLFMIDYHIRDAEDNLIGFETHYLQVGGAALPEFDNYGTWIGFANHAQWDYGSQPDATLQWADFASFVMAQGTAAGDMLVGGSGDNQLFGGDGADTIEGGAGNDTIGGDAGNDRLYGEAGDDHLMGGLGKDRLYGGSGNDRLFGDRGDDRLYGGKGNDTLNGGAGNDLLEGGSGDDLLRGGIGNDTLVAGTGSDRLEGGAGADVFVWNDAAESANNATRDRVLDYEVGIDRVDISGMVPEFRFVDRLSGEAGQVTYNAKAARLLVDIDGDGAADFSVQFSAGVILTEADLVW